VADRLAVTGILLVGGASSRFGTAKALAMFRGETLAQRGWRLLHEVCDEVLAVGKEADRLDLPFAVLDDGAEERAPVYGLITGLRAAAHDVCVVLPVDCPLVTPELLRALAEAVAVPQTGPLPGAYAKTMLPELEKRVSDGELSLRGVNATVRMLDEAQLLNVNAPRDRVTAAVTEWASEREDVRALLLVGSHARTDGTADRWSDLDLVLLVDRPQRLADDAGWVAEFGTPVLTFLEPTPVGSVVERRVLYDDGQDVDFPLVQAAGWRESLTSPEVATLLARGHRVLYDELGLESELQKLTVPQASWPPGTVDLTQLASDFWYHALWTARKLRRGEVFTAKGGLDGYLKSLLVTLLEWHARAVDPSVDTWHGGRFLERWADPGALAALETAYARYDLRDVARALWATIDLWQGLEEETAKRLGLMLELDHADLRRRIAEVVPDPRHRSTLSP
jgi:molybdopterin-guanine dinucleotide biosynthesis protein A